jgi:hypothetical protein
MIMYGLPNEELILFELPCTSSYKPKMENSCSDRVTVEGGVLTAQQIVPQLQPLVYVEDYHWDARPT